MVMSWSTITNRMIFASIALGALALMVVALYMQYVLELVPCNLCMFQRVFVVLAGGMATIAAIHHPQSWGNDVYATLVILLSALGALTAGRQLWLQHLPEDQVPACGPDLDYMLDVYPFFEMIAEVLRGSGDCAKVQWTFINLSIPAWTLICFIAAIGLAGVVYFNRRGTH